jgi:hypothetical protein
MALARTTDPQTSHEAAASVDNVSQTQYYIWLALRRPATDTELVERYNNTARAPRASESGIRSRRAELVELGMVEDSGLRQKLPSGRNAIVWKRTIEVEGC